MTGHQNQTYDSKDHGQGVKRNGIEQFLEDDTMRGDIVEPHSLQYFQDNLVLGKATSHLDILFNDQDQGPVTKKEMK